MATFDIARLYGGRTKITYPSSNPEQPIIFWVNHPTQLIVGAAVGMLEKSQTGDERSYREREDMLVMLAKLCVHTAENLDGWPTHCHVLDPSGWSILSDEALASIPEAVRRYILLDIGRRLEEAIHVSTEEGNESAPQPTGATIENPDEGKTEDQPNISQTVASVEIQS